MVQKTFAEINEKIKAGKAVVLTAEEVIPLVEEKGPEKVAEEVDVVTTGTFGPMCSSGAFLNFGHADPANSHVQSLVERCSCLRGTGGGGRLYRRHRAVGDERHGLRRSPRQ